MATHSSRLPFEVYWGNPDPDKPNQIETTDYTDFPIGHDVTDFFFSLFSVQSVKSADFFCESFSLGSA